MPLSKIAIIFSLKSSGLSEGLIDYEKVSMLELNNPEIKPEPKDI